MTNDQLKDHLDSLVERYNRPDFIPNDPISIPHQFSKPQDIEISGLIAAIFSWGQRKTIISKSNEFMNLMDNSPHDFLLNHTEEDLKRFTRFVHRTFQPTDALYFIEFLSGYYKTNESLEGLFAQGDDMKAGLTYFHNAFFRLPFAPNRTRKHIPTPVRKSSCKRLNMFLRWMVRQDNSGVDFGIWKTIDPSILICPLDVHVGNVARHFEILNRKQNDWNAATELTENLRAFDPKDPVKYDFALFGFGVGGGLV